VPHTVATPKNRKTSTPSAQKPHLNRLQARFATFRRTHAPGSRIPVELKRAAVEAVLAGARPGAVTLACGLSSNQLWLWRKQQAKPSQPATVLTLTDDEPVLRTTHEPACSTPAPTTDLEFQVQLAGWTLRVRLDAPTQGRR
jgi:transposase-like protein